MNYPGTTNASCPLIGITAIKRSQPAMWRNADAWAARKWQTCLSPITIRALLGWPMQCPQGMFWGARLRAPFFIGHPPDSFFLFLP
ncbi:hypothetical protein LJR118_003842 [Acidovorax sp. LjRoot118]